MVSVTTCGLCAFEYEPAGAACRSRGCPLSLSDCRLEHCPRCGYAQPAIATGLTAWLQRWMRPSQPPPAQFAAQPLSRLQTNQAVAIDRVECDPELATRLTVLGLTPSTPISILQRFPTFVVSCHGTELALERSVAEAIWVRPLGTSIAAQRSGR
jgi:Fe2+ transport system protein FeoA